MRKNQLIVSILVFLAGFALSAIIDARHTVSSTIQASSAESQVTGLASKNVAPQIIGRAGGQRQYWEYRVVSNDSSQSRNNSQSNLESELSRLGEQGFEVFSV
ncbi:MAG: hypothetical protein J2P31_12790, partial [Blastocatellia bacterium]|nr:hypothetical protein [Blastocatellia bacterium]